MDVKDAMAADAAIWAAIPEGEKAIFRAQLEALSNSLDGPSADPGLGQDPISVKERIDHLLGERLQMGHAGWRWRILQTILPKTWVRRILWRQETQADNWAAEQLQKSRRNG